VTFDYDIQHSVVLDVT